MKMSTLLVRTVPIVIFIIIVVFLAIGLQRDPRIIPTEMIDRQLPDFALSELHVEEATVSKWDMMGQTTLLNVFGSWCAACITEHATLMEVSKLGAVQIIGLNWRDTRPDALAWLERFGDPYTKIAFDDESELAIELGVTGAPETFIIGPDGRIRYKQFGPITDEVWVTTIAPIVQAIAEETE